MFGLYFHIPFCDGKCNYCNFFSKQSTEAEMDLYTEHLDRAIRSWGERLDRTVDTVYFGGGTPSLLGHSRLIRILNAVKESFVLSNDTEITLEVNPSSTNFLDFAALRNAGFNRLSVGLQSANENELKILERRHSLEDTDNTITAARRSGFENISLDVILAIPGQTIESLHNTLDYCADRHVDHISAYILKIEPETRFYQERDKLPFFEDDAQAAIYEEAVRCLDKLGYRQYEISNFSKEGFQSRHNLIYWHDEEYLGLGPSAHSFIDGKRFYYDNSFDAFYSGAVLNEGAGGDKEEYIMLALRLTEGLHYARYEERFKEPVSDRMIQAAQILSEKGFVKMSADSFSLTVNGFLVSNSVIGYLLQNS